MYTEYYTFLRLYLFFIHIGVLSRCYEDHLSCIANEIGFKSIET